jgi:SAM-dependent methyltransferase
MRAHRYHAIHGDVLDATPRLLAAVDPASLQAEPYDAIALLNVLDRCDKPRTLLQRCLALLKPGGRLIVALALPYRPFYYLGPSTPDPLERLECDHGPSGAVEPDGVAVLPPIVTQPEFDTCEAIFTMSYLHNIEADFAAAELASMFVADPTLCYATSANRPMISATGIAVANTRTASAIARVTMNTIDVKRLVVRPKRRSRRV